MSDITIHPTSTVTGTFSCNWIHAQAEWTGPDGVRRTVAQFNGDGTLYVDWEGVEKMCAVLPLGPDKDNSVLWLHVLLAMYYGNRADAPRDFQWQPAAAPEPAEADAR